MCGQCDTHLTYAQLYNIVYAKGKHQRDACVENMLNIYEHSCLRLQKRMARNLQRMMATQQITKHANPAMTRRITAENTRVQRIVTMRTRRLARFMLRHTYRPNGRMFFRMMASETLLSP